MALSEQEQRLLDEMERHLYQNEADVMSTAPRTTSSVSTRAVVLAVLAVAVGLGIVVAALAAQMWVLGIVGFLVMLAGVLFAFRRREGAVEGEQRPTGPAASGPARGTTKPSSGFMDRLEDRWDRRRNGE